MHTLHSSFVSPARHHQVPPALIREAQGRAAAAAAAAVARALPKRRRHQQRRRQQKEEPKQFSDEELIRELNSSHLWLPDVDSDFGMDDIAAHVTSRNQDTLVDLTRPASSSSSSAKCKGGKAKGRAAAGAAAAADSPDLLPSLAPDSGQPPPEWVQSLRAEGFDVLSRDGQLFLQRGTVTPQQQQQQQGAARAAAAAAGRPPSNQAQAAARAAAGVGSVPGAAPAAAVGVQVSDRSLAVHAEFDAAVWQDAIHSLTAGTAGTQGSSSSREDDDDDPAASAAGAWYATTPSSSASSSSGGATSSSSAGDTSRSTAGTPLSSSSEGAPSSSSSSSSSGRRMSPGSIQRLLLSFQHPSGLLALLAAVFPAWAANGCWLVSQSGPGVVAAPGPAEAAAALKGLALAARRARLNNVQLQSLAREPLVAGCVEALRLTPPRTTPQQPPDLSRRLWSIAKAYWMQPGPTAAAAAAQQLLAAGGPGGGAPLEGGSALLGAATGGVLTQGAGGGGGASQPKGGEGPGQPAVLGSLLVQLQSRGGGVVSKQQLAAAQALVAARGEDQLRRVAVVSALWGLACIGGPLFFQQELDALCQVAQAKFSRWSPGPSELSDVLWGLAHSRHWTPLLPQLEACWLAAGGPPAATAAEAVTSIWAFAVLGHTPQALLQQLETQGWSVKTDRGPRAPSRQQQQQQQQQGDAGSSSSSSSSQLGALRDSQLCTLAWSLACLEQVSGGLFRAVWVEVCRRGPRLAADTRQAVQLAQAALAIRLEGGYQPEQLLPGEGTTQLLSAASAAFSQQNAELAAQRAHSSYQRAIAGTLAKLRVMHVLEDTSSGYAVDITIPSLRVAVEADGPSHFSRTTPPSKAPSPSSPPQLRQLGATAMKRRHLQALGWAVVNVPYSHWDRLSDEPARVEYLQRRIAAARREQQQAAAAAAAAAAPGGGS